jgi:hypothetical protein
MRSPAGGSRSLWTDSGHGPILGDEYPPIAGKDCFPLEALRQGGNLPSERTSQVIGGKRESERSGESRRQMSFRPAFFP